MAKEHSKGAWRVVDDHGSLDVYGHTDFPICKVPKMWRNIEINEANANLLSLAPEMYEAIKPLNLALDNYWNSQTKGDDLVKKINKEQQKCWEILKKVG